MFLLLIDATAVYVTFYHYEDGINIRNILYICFCGVVFDHGIVFCNIIFGTLYDMIFAKLGLKKKIT